MSKLTIRNHAQPEWDAVIEASARFMLGALVTRARRIEVELDHRDSPGGHYPAYTCKVIVVESSGERLVLHNQQPDGRRAIEGAMARARRAITRLSRSRQGGWNQASTQ
jgi:hypothetical protein